MGYLALLMKLSTAYNMCSLCKSIMLNQSTSVIRFNAFLQLNILGTSKRLHFLSLSLLFCSISVYFYYARNISSRKYKYCLRCCYCCCWIVLHKHILFIIYIFALFCVACTMKSCFVFLQNASRVCVMRIKFKVNLQLNSALDFYTFF